jgi:hypothetical protein
MIHTYTYKHPVIFNGHSHAMIFVTVDSHLLIVFDISNLTQYPIHHSVYLEFNVALLFRYSKSQFK